jgi:hypothetical protein
MTPTIAIVDRANIQTDVNIDVVRSTDDPTMSYVIVGKCILKIKTEEIKDPDKLIKKIEKACKLVLLDD